MGNWCLNEVRFIGDELQLQELGKMIAEVIKREEKSGRGQLFPVAEVKEGYLFEMSYTDGQLRYLTKYMPNTVMIMALADYLELDYVHLYCEPAMGVFGQYSYHKGQLFEVFISAEDYAKFDFEYGKGYTFEDKLYLTEDEVLRIILNQKSQELLKNQSKAL